MPRRQHRKQRLIDGANAHFSQQSRLGMVRYPSPAMRAGGERAISIAVLLGRHC